MMPLLNPGFWYQDYVGLIKLIGGFHSYNQFMYYPRILWSIDFVSSLCVWQNLPVFIFSVFSGWELFKYSWDFYNSCRIIHTSISPYLHLILCIFFLGISPFYLNFQIYRCKIFHNVILLFLKYLQDLQRCLLFYFQC